MVIKVFKYATWTNANSSQEINSKEEVNWFNVQKINATYAKEPNLSRQQQEQIYIKNLTLSWTPPKRRTADQVERSSQFQWYRRILKEIN